MAKTLGEGTHPRVDIRTGFSPLIHAESIQTVNKIEMEGLREQDTDGTNTGGDKQKDTGLNT